MTTQQPRTYEEERTGDDHGRPRAREKLADRIKVVAEMLQRGIKDPRLGFITITDTRVTG